MTAVGAIEEDKKDHPACSYSTSSSQSCRRVNGQMECETIESVIRRCQGEKPCEIYNSRVRSDGGEAQERTGQDFDDAQRAMKDIMDHAFGGGGLGGAFGDGRGLPEFPMRGFFSLPPPTRRGGADGGGGGGGMFERQPVAPHHYPRGQYPFSEKKLPSSSAPPGTEVDTV